MTPRSSTDAPPADERQVVNGALVAGLVSGGVLTTMMTLMSALRGKDVWFGMKGAAAPFLGERAMSPGFDALAVPMGLALHLFISIGWALGFAALFYGLSKKATVLAGAFWGVVVWLGMYYVVLPLVGLASMRAGAPMSRAVLYHVFFGVILALAFLPFQRRQPTQSAFSSSTSPSASS
jgi:hypothetical protein